jgi:site-specific recombinase XerD
VARYKRVDPSYEGRIFHQAIRKHGKATMFPNMKKGGIVGHNHFNIITKGIVLQTGMDKPNLNTPAARRRSGITRLANKSNGVCESVQMFVACHKFLSTHAKYQEVNEEMMQGRYEASHYKESKFGKRDVSSFAIYAYSNSILFA